MPGLIIGIGKPKMGGMGEKPMKSGKARLQKAARALIDAVNDDDEEGVAMALETAHKLCSAMAEEPEEPEESEGSIYDAEE